LIDAKDGIGLEEGDIPFDFVAVSVGHRLGEAARIHHGAAGLTLADMRVEFAGLLERHPDRRAEAARDGF
jgi:hypothetical protein